MKPRRPPFSRVICRDSLWWLSPLLILNGGSTDRTLSISKRVGAVAGPFWFLGFVEGDGTFGIQNLSPYFQIAQHNRSVALLEAAKLF